MLNWESVQGGPANNENNEGGHMSVMQLLFSFSGRVGRMQYWLVEIGLWLATVVILTLLGVESGTMTGAEQADFQAEMEKAFEAMPEGAPMEAMPESSAPSGAAGTEIEIGPGEMAGGIAAVLALVIVGILNLWITLAITVKRFHDRDKSGWWVLIGLVPAIGALWILIECGFLKGTTGDNRFGADPVPA
jgi:uncharacterized membrane protein YhaH (DUF805 family)